MKQLSPLLKTKFFLPQPTSDFVARKMLSTKFDKLKTRPVLLVSASTGYGKSTVIADFLTSQEEKYTWLSLSEKENELTLFIIYLIKAIQITAPKFGVELLELLKAPELPDIEDLSALMLNDIAEFDKLLYLTLDDYHLINNSEIHCFLSHLFEYPQPYFRIILITRFDPELPLAEWRNKNKLVEIRSSDLKFGRSEIIDFYRKSISYQPDEVILSKLIEITDGWISGLRMLSLTAQNGDELNLQFLNFKYKNSRIISQLVRAVLANQSAAIRNKLLRLSLLNEFNVGLFTEFCLDQGEIDQKEVLFKAFIEKIIRSNMFIIALDDKHDWYRFHHMFLEHIQLILLETYDKTKVDKLRIIAADWYFRNNLPEESIRFYLQAEQVMKALDIFTKYRLDLISETRFQQLETIFNLFPKDIVEKSGILMVTEGWLILQKGNIPALAKHVEPLEEMLRQEGHPRELQDLLIGEVHSMKAYDRYLADVDMKACFEHSEQAIKLVKDKNPYATGVAWIFYGAALQILGQPVRARKDLYKELESCTNPIVRGQLFFIMCFLDWYECDLTAMIKDAEHLLDVGYESNIKLLKANGSVLAGMAHYNKGNDEKALKHLHLAHELRHHTYLHMSFASGMALASLYAKMGKKEESNKIIKDYEKTALKQGGKLFVKITKSAAADLAWRYQKDDFGLKWARDNDFKDFLPLANLYSPELVQARILVLDNDPVSHSLAQDIINNTIPYFENRYDLNVLLRVFVIQALLYHKTGDTIKAFEALQKAIHLSSIGHHIKPYLELGELMKKMLIDYRNSGIKNTHLDKILQLFSKDEIDNEKANISQREVEILKLVGLMTNKDVGNQLFISEKTVKTHITNINKKLNVNNKFEAIDKAKDLGLI